MSALLGGQMITRRKESRPSGSPLRFNGATTTAGREVACRWETRQLTFVATVGRPDGRDPAQMITRAAGLYSRVVGFVRGRSTRARKVVTSSRRHLGDAATDIVVSGSVRERHLIYRTGSVVVELDVLAVVAVKPAAPIPSADSIAAVAALLLTRITPADAASTTAALPTTAAATSVAPTTVTTAPLVATTANAPVVTSLPLTTLPATVATGVVAQPAGGNVLILAVELQFEDPGPGGQAVWITNRAKAEVDVSCWVLGVASGMKATIAPGTHILPDRVVRLATPTGLLRSSDTVTLFDRSGREVDRTPQLTDTAVDDRFWFREGDSWRFGRTVYAGRVSDGRITTIAPSGC